MWNAEFGFRLEHTNACLNHNRTQKTYNMLFLQKLNGILYMCLLTKGLRPITQYLRINGGIRYGVRGLE